MGLNEIPIVDGHLDLAENATLFGLEMTASIAERRRVENLSERQATVSLPEMERGGIAVACATVTAGFLAEDVKGIEHVPASALYSTAKEAEAQALRQIDLYERWQAEGRVRILKSAADLDRHMQLWRTDRKPGLVLLMEGADPIVEVADLPAWWARGLRMIGLTYGDTKYATGVARGLPQPRPGGLTADGVAMMERMAETGFIWDIAHLAEGAVRQGLAMGFPRVCASHANARALTPTDRHLSDDVMRAVGARGGMIGVVLYNNFLDPRWRQDNLRITLAEHARRQFEHIASVAGWEHVGIGSDLDGGFGLEESPAEIETIADLRAIGEIVPPAARDGVLGGNWLAFLRAALPN